MHGLRNLSQKVRFLKIALPFLPLIPCLIPPTDDRETTERTPIQLPANKKCCLLIFAIAIGCLVLADFPASSLPVTLVHLVLPFPFLSVVILCGVPETLVAFWGALCGSAREILLAFTPYTLHLTQQLCCPPLHPPKAHNLRIAHSTSRCDSTAVGRHHLHFTPKIAQF